MFANIKKTEKHIEYAISFIFIKPLICLNPCPEGVSHSSDINVLTSDSQYVYTAADNEIFGWKYGHKWVLKMFNKFNKLFIV